MLFDYVLPLLQKKSYPINTQTTNSSKKPSLKSGNNKIKNGVEKTTQKDN
jgi:hypothetical protein